MPRAMGAAEFKAKCLRIMDEVAATGEAVTVTKRGKPVARLVPVTTRPPTLRGFLKGGVKAGRDIISPVAVPWDAERS